MDISPGTKRRRVQEEKFWKKWKLKEKLQVLSRFMNCTRNKISSPTLLLWVLKIICPQLAYGSRSIGFQSYLKVSYFSSPGFLIQFSSGFRIEFSWFPNSILQVSESSYPGFLIQFSWFPNPGLLVSLSSYPGLLIQFSWIPNLGVLIQFSRITNPVIQVS